MLKNYLNRPRKKAWIGAAIGAAVGIGSAIFGASKQSKAQKEQAALQRGAELRRAGLESAANLTRAYANEDELSKEFAQRFYRMGGRKKYAGGGWSDIDTNALINGLGSAGSSIASNVIGNNVIPMVTTNTARIKYKQVGEGNATYDSAARSELLNNYYQTSMLKAGGKRYKR